MKLRVEDFWGLTVDVRTAALYRLVFVGAAALQFWGTFPYPTGFYCGPSGLLEALEGGVSCGGLDVIRRGVPWALALVAVGWGTRPALAFLWFWHLQVIRLTPYNDWSSDHLLTALNFFLLFLSTDRAYALGTGFRGATGRVAAWPLRFVQWMLCALYLTAAAAKAPHLAWWNGTEIATYLNSWQAVWPTLWPRAFCVVLGVGTLLMEGFIGVGVWVPRLRRYAAGVAVCFHLGVAVLTHIKVFSIIGMFLPLFYLHRELDRGWGRLAGAPKANGNDKQKEGEGPAEPQLGQA